MKTLPKFKEDMIVEAEAIEEGLTIKPSGHAARPFSEEALLNGLKAHADKLASISDKDLGP